MIENKTQQKYSSRRNAPVLAADTNVTLSPAVQSPRSEHSHSSMSDNIQYFESNQIDFTKKNWNEAECEQILESDPFDNDARFRLA